MFRSDDRVNRCDLRGQGTVFVVVVIMAQNLSKNGRFWVDGLASRVVLWDVVRAVQGTACVGPDVRLNPALREIEVLQV
jgi:hypothetical protein